MRALLVVNPKATAMSPRSRDVLAAAFGSRTTLDMAVTKARGHATELAAQAVDEGVDLVVAVGGDGTVNEVVNGLLRHGLNHGGPCLAVVPTGGTNVFARALGLSNEAIEATGQILEAIDEGRQRRITLGRAEPSGASGADPTDDAANAARWWTFCAGLGVDAAVVHKVEDKRSRGKRATHPLYLRAAIARFYLGTDRRHAPLTVSAPSLEEPQDVFVALVCNTDPWTYFGNWPIRPCPQASFDAGLDLFALRKMSTPYALRTVRRFLAKRQPTEGDRGRHVLALHDVDELTVAAREAQPFQVDGEPLGHFTQVRLTAVRQALDVVV